MSSSTATIPSNTNDRKRSISSSIRPSPSPPSAKRHGLAGNVRRTTTNKNKRSSERPNRSKQKYRHLDNKSSSSESSRSSSDSNHRDDPSSPIDIQNSNEIKRAHFNGNSKYKSTLIVKPTATMDQRNHSTTHDDSNDEYERTKQVFTNSSHAVVQPSVMTIVTTPDLSKKSAGTDNVIIQQSDGNGTNSTKLVKLVVPQSTAASSAIKMLSSNNGLVSALRVPTVIQLTKTSPSSSTKIEPNSSLISSSSSLNNLSDIPMDLTDKQQSIVDDRSSASLPPTPPPPVLDRTNSNNQQTTSSTTTKNTTKEISSINTKILEEIDVFPMDEIKLKRHTSIFSDWSVPPTSELSPTSLTSSSPDLIQNSVSLDDSLLELDSSIKHKHSKKRRHRSFSSFPVSNTVQFNDKSMKSKSLTRLSHSSNMRVMFIQHKRSLTSSPILKLSSSQRIKKRRRDYENLLLNQKSITKHPKIEFDNDLIIRNLLHEMIERILSTNNERDNSLKTLLIKPVPNVPQRLTLNVLPNRSTKSSMKKKSLSTSQSVDSTQFNESRSMVISRKKLDELAFLLHANAQRADYERMNNPNEVEESMREAWSRMSNHKKNSYYKRVIQIYKRPHRDVVITASPSISETNCLSSNDFTDTSISTPPMNLLSNDYQRQTSTPLSFHSVASTTTPNDESPTKPNIFTDIVNELIKGAKGLDKLSCSASTFTNTIDTFVRSSIEKQTEILTDLEQEVEKKCSNQINRANIFWKQKVTYFATKYQINSSNQSMNELTLIVKYFYFYVLLLNSRKQDVSFGSALTDLVQGNLTFYDEQFTSATLTSIIEDLILPSTLANDYLASQILIINQIEYSLPFVRNVDLENDLLNSNESTLPSNPFADYNDLEDYLNRCEHMTTISTTTTTPQTNIPMYPIQPSHHSSMYYPSYHPSLPSSYYYTPSPQSPDVNNYYYNPTSVYSNSQTSMYTYGQPTSYYHPSTGYYYNQSQPTYPYPTQSNSTNDIPTLSKSASMHRTYRPVQRTYSNSQQPPTPTTPVVYDSPNTVVAPQSKPMNSTTTTTTTTTNYPS